MPQGVEVYVEGGFATIDFVDRTLRGPGLSRLIDSGGPSIIEKMTRSGPRVQYRVPEGNAREAGLLDTPADGVRPDRVDLGMAEALASASTEGARPVQPGSHNSFSQTMRAGEYRTGITDEATFESTAEAVLGHTSVATTVSPDAELASALAPLHAEVIAAVPGPVFASGDPAPFGTPVGVGSPTDATAASAGASEADAAIAEGKFPEGDPEESWTRKQLDSYAAIVLKRDTTSKVDYPSKAHVLAAFA